jgi:hypothetical protein
MSFGTAKRKSTSRNIGKAFEGLIVWIGTAIPKFIQWVTGDTGGQILLGLLMVYFLLVNIESYWQSVGEEVFIPKPFVTDGANFGTIARLIFLPNFWMVTLFVLSLNAVSATFFRDIAISAARKRYETVAGEKLPAPPNLSNSLELASFRYRQLRTAGMKRVKMAGFGALLCLTVDLIGNYAGFPWLSVTSGKLVTFLWWLCSTFGFEVCGALLENKELRDGKKPEQ